MLFIYRNKQWDVSTTSVTFGGKEAYIGIPLKESIVIKNRKKNSFTFTLKVSNDRVDPKYRIKIVPDKFKLEKVKNIYIYIHN